MMKKLLILAMSAFLLAAPAFAQSALSTEAKQAPKQFVLHLNPFKPIDTSSTKFEDMTAQIAHVTSAYSVVETSQAAGHNVVGLSVMTAFAATKEFWYDKKYERQSFKRNLRDFGFYSLGIGLAVLQGKLQQK